MLTDDVARVLISEESIQKRVRELGAQVSADYRGQDLLLLCILKGGIVFLTDLMRHIEIPHGIEFMAISSYGAATESSGIVRIVMDLETSILDRNVLIVEDIVDTGNTLAYVKSMLQTRGPRSLRVCSLLSKPDRREVEVELDYVGFDIPNEFVVGYGLDYNERYRNLRFIGVLKPELYRSEA
ncbi:MAG: hypoxanthine phosphoribosyltransferase [Anaerolineae bacterium]|nr:hypoxanthine phosphoribosyltransferase [Anaerolineae bacterium]